MSDLRVGLVGTGHISKSHLEGWRKTDGCRVTALFDVDAEAARRRADEFGVRDVARDLDELIDGSDIVDVSTPPATHAAIAHAVVEAGKHLLIEKPIVIDPADWVRLREGIERGPSRVAVVHNLKFTDAVLRARALVDSGRVGSVLRISRRFLTDPTTDRMMAGPHWSHSLPGGRWFETLPHALYLVHSFAGALDLAHVTATRTPDAPVGTTADEVTVTLTDGRRTAVIEYSAHCPLNRRTMTVIGTDAVLEIDVLADALAVSKRRDGSARRAIGGIWLDAGAGVLQSLGDRGRYLLHRARRQTPHGRLIEAFADHLLRNGDSPTPLPEIDYVVRLSDSIGRAIDDSVTARSDAED